MAVPDVRAGHCRTGIGQPEDRSRDKQQGEDVDQGKPLAARKRRHDQGNEHDACRNAHGQVDHGAGEFSARGGNQVVGQQEVSRIGKEHKDRRSHRAVLRRLSRTEGDDHQNDGQDDRHAQQDQQSEFKDVGSISLAEHVGKEGAHAPRDDGRKISVHVAEQRIGKNDVFRIKRGQVSVEIAQEDAGDCIQKADKQSTDGAHERDDGKCTVSACGGFFLFGGIHARICRFFHDYLL